MKITEPKTPYVRYNAELDEVEGGTWSPKPDIVSLTLDIDIPTFELGGSSAPSPPPASPSPVEPPSPRRASFSTGKKPGRSSSGSSNRSTSFSIPSDFPRGEVEEESSDDEPMSPEGVLRIVLIWRLHHIDCDLLNPVLVAAAKHEAFLKARGRHYSNEAEAMKVRTCTFFAGSIFFPVCALRTDYLGPISSARPNLWRKMTTNRREKEARLCLCLPLMAPLRHRRHRLMGRPTRRGLLR